MLIAEAGVKLAILLSVNLLCNKARDGRYYPSLCLLSDLVGSVVSFGKI